MSAINLLAEAAPSTPPTGQVAVYPAADKLLKYKDDTGLERGISITTGGVVTINKQILSSNVVLADGESGYCTGPLSGGGFSITGSGTARFVIL